MIPANQSYNFDAVVVGSGPNGFAAAITVARSGYSVLMIEAKDVVGGGMRSSELTLPGFVHDICSAVHPLAVASPFFGSLDLTSHGLEWIYPVSSLAHPLDDGTSVLLERSVNETAEGLGRDSAIYRNLMIPIVSNWDKLIHEILRPMHFPGHPFFLGTFGLKASQSVEHFVRNKFKTEQARALFAGIAAHSIMPMYRKSGAAFGLVLGAAGHVVGWPVARGGSQTIAGALRNHLIALGGEIRTGKEVRTLDELPKARVVLLDVTPRQLALIAGDRLPQDYRRRLLEYRYGPGVFKMDWALDGPIPWKAAACLRAATVHVGGNFDEIAHAENSVWDGKHPEKPLVILAQQTLFDPTRAPDGKHTAWAYCHVPNGSNVDMSDRIESQIERFAPGFRERILARGSMNTGDMEAYNPNYVGGDIAGGIQSPIEMMLRPQGQWKAYSTAVRGIYLCSSSMPPGAGVHGMCGYYAAQRALRELS